MESEQYNLATAQEEPKHHKPEVKSGDGDALVEQDENKKLVLGYLRSYLDKLRKNQLEAADEDLSAARSLQQKFGIPPGVLEADPELQDQARNTILNLLKKPYYSMFFDFSEEIIEKIEKIQTDLLLPDDVYTSPELQEAAERNIRELWLKSIDGYLSNPNNFSYFESAKASEYLYFARRLKQAFDIPVGKLLEAKPELQEKSRKAILNLLKKIDPSSPPVCERALRVFQAIIELSIPDEVYISPELQEAAERTIRKLLSAFLDELEAYDGSLAEAINYLYFARDLQQAFDIPDGAPEADPELQERAKKVILALIRVMQLERFKKIITSNLVSNDIYTQPEFQEAAKKGIVNCINSIIEGNRDDEIGEVLEVKQIFQLDGNWFEETLRTVTLKKLEKINNLGSLNYIADKIQKFGFVPANFFSHLFFSHPEISQNILRILSENVSWGNLENVEQSIKQYGFSDDVYSSFDLQASESDALNKVYILKRFTKYLGDTSFYQKFPKTLERAKALIIENLETYPDIANSFVANLDKYYQQPWVADYVAKAILDYSVALKFIYAVENNAVWANEPWVDTILEEAKAIVQQHNDEEDKYGHGTEGFSEHDPYENHPWRFGGRQIRIASVLQKMMVGQADHQKLAELGIDEKEIGALLLEANQKVEAAYQNFLEQVRSNPSIKEDDKQALLNPESSSVRMTPLLDNVRAFVARYFVQSVKGDVKRLSEIRNLINELNRILYEGFRRYIHIHEVDIPLYDKLYEEFDNVRETGRYPLEVFLGRDGIYAWIGRRAQDVARRRKMGLEGRKKLKEMGEVIEIHPRYIVYPRYFRDNLNYETKRRFLEQEGISPDADPLFYDTGYTGTVPEQIMKIMDFEQEDIESRIRLLSAPFVHRRVRGIPENARQEIIEYIEHNAQTEESAKGLIINKKTGKIRHIARPTNPEEQFYFMMVKQAIARHYWLQEQLHHEPSGNVNLDSEHYAIRIRQEYEKLLPQEFLSDPKTFFAKHGELIKGSKGKGKYPDEEVILFKLTDGTEIVAKKIELRKAKEARKEYAILIAAKKAGLPTAEPVGFLKGKEYADGSYLLMRKLEGRSGRTFAKELRATGEYSAEQIKAIMKQVAEKNREMAALFRQILNIDKPWRIQDTIIRFNAETGTVESVIPIEWERARTYNPKKPQKIDGIA